MPETLKIHSKDGDQLEITSAKVQPLNDANLPEGDMVALTIPQADANNTEITTAQVLPLIFQANADKFANASHIKLDQNATLHNENESLLVADFMYTANSLSYPAKIYVDMHRVMAPLDETTAEAPVSQTTSEPTQSVAEPEKVDSAASVSNSNSESVASEATTESVSVSKESTSVSESVTSQSVSESASTSASESTSTSKKKRTTSRKKAAPKTSEPAVFASDEMAKTLLMHDTFDAEPVAGLTIIVNLASGGVLTAPVFDVHALNSKDATAIETLQKALAKYYQENVTDVLASAAIKALNLDATEFEFDPEQHEAVIEMS